jgi:hypothetical protein
LASDFRAVWLVWLKMGERTSGKAFGAKTIRLMRRFRELLNKVWGLEGCLPIFTPCARSVESGLISAGLPCYRVEVDIRCLLTRQRVVGLSFKRIFNKSTRFRVVIVFLIAYSNEK